MKQILILSCFLFGCSDFISVFYSTEILENEQDLNIQETKDLGGNEAINGLDMSSIQHDQMTGGIKDMILGGILGGKQSDIQIDQQVEMIGGSMALADMILTDHHLSKDATVIDPSICQCNFKLKIGNQLLSFNACNDCLLDFDYQYTLDTVPRVNGGIFKFNMTDDPNAECNLTFSVTALSCGIEKVYQIGSTLNLRNCMGLDRNLQGSYQIIQNEGLIANFRQIYTGNQTGDFSNQPLITSISGYLGTTLINGIQVHNHRGDLVPIKLYGDFSISNTQVPSQGNESYECHQLNGVPTFDMDGDLEAIYVYGEEQQDCNDQNPLVNSLASEHCYPCGTNCPEMILISRGSFMMGSDPSEPSRFTHPDEYPNHLVHVSNDFYVSKAEITVGQFRSCVMQGQCDEPDRWHAQNGGCNWSNMPDILEDHPMNCITWENARKYAKWVNGDLLSESQWEYLATGAGQLPLGQESIYPWGNDQPNCDFANFYNNGTYCITNRGDLNFNGNPPTYTKAICSTIRGNTPQGLCDMSGNVMEWVLDEWHYNYDQIPMAFEGSDLAWCNDFGICQTNPGTLRVTRGGTWNNDMYDIRSSYRHTESGSLSDHRIGFRIARASPSIFRQ